MTIEGGAPTNSSGREEVTVDHVPHSVGGLGGHLLRRAVHICIVFVPWLYYWHGDAIAMSISIDRRMVPSIIGITVLLMEAIRLRSGLVVYGQRAYEANQTSALFWGAFSICIVLLAAPEIGVAGAALGAPIIWSLAIVDPALGEARRAGYDKRTCLCLGFALCALIWSASSFFLTTPIILAPIMAAVTVAAERPRLKWLDDNGAMVLAPLSLIILAGPFL